MTESGNLYSEEKDKIIAWAKIAKAIYVPVIGSGGGSVKVNRRDFIDLLRSLENFYGHATFAAKNACLYIGG